MDGAMGVVTYGLGTLLGLMLVVVLTFWFIQDITQKKHTILRNFPVIGRLRYLFERQGEYFRQYFFANDREEMPFNRAVRSWVYRLAKDEGGTIGFGSTNDLREPGSILFVNHPYPVLEEDRLPTPAIVIGENYCEHPFEARSIVNGSRRQEERGEQPVLPTRSTREDRRPAIARGRRTSRGAAETVHKATPTTPG